MTSAVSERVAVSPQPGLRLLSARQLLLFTLALLLGMAGAWYGYRWWTVDRFFAGTDDAYVGGNVTEIAPHVAGFVSRILISDNQHVHRGQLLLRLDDRDYRAALAQAAAVVRQRTADLASLEAKYVLQQALIAKAAADRAADDARATFARIDALRYAQLARTRFGTLQQAERSQAAAQEARSAVKSADAGLAATRQNLAVLDTEIAAARAGLAAAQAQWREARLELGYTLIRSPIDGYVGNRAAQKGAYVQAGTHLLSIVPARGLWVDANFKEDDLARMQPGDPATIVADVLPGRVFHGHLLSLAPATGAVFSVIPPENATGNFTKIVQRVPVRITIDGNDGRLGLLRPGLSATVTVDTRPDAEARR